MVISGELKIALKHMEIMTGSFGQAMDQTKNRELFISLREGLDLCFVWLVCSSGDLETDRQ